jgi:lipid II:glycine glycyltransferase (peptidoglycan interpeptide bridge formation enzyme)
VLIFRHGRGATYQAGWTTEHGRQTRAHHLLLWRAIETLKADGVAALDLGGINPRMAEGVTQFKEGLGGEPVTLIGLYG